MTNRNTDIHCYSCGTYMYSHWAEEVVMFDAKLQEEYANWKPELCKECKHDTARGMKRPDVVQREWRRMADRRLRAYELFALADADDVKLITSFARTPYNYEQLQLGQKEYREITPEEWKAIAYQNLEQYAAKEEQLQLFQGDANATIEDFIERELGKKTDPVVQMRASFRPPLDISGLMR